MRKNGAIFRCIICGKEFYRSMSRIKDGNNKCCGVECSRRYNSQKGTAFMTEYHASGQYNEKKEQISQKQKNKYSKPQNYELHLGRYRHREVAEQMLGRKLQKGEVVHHINGDKRDNRPENLMVFSNTWEHAKWHAENGDYFGREVKGK